MHIFSYLKAVFVLLLTFVLTALFMLMLYGVQMLAFPKNLNGIAIGFAGASIVLFAGACLQYFATSFLYDKDDRAELQLFGGVRFGDLSQAIANGTGATWPFAKLSASRETLRYGLLSGTTPGKELTLGWSSKRRDYFRDSGRLARKTPR